MGNKDYENRGRHLKNLPLLSTDFYHWRQLTVSVCLGVLKKFYRKSLSGFNHAKHFFQSFLRISSIIMRFVFWHSGGKKRNMMTVRMSALAERKTCENLSGFPLLELKVLKGGCATFL